MKLILILALALSGCVTTQVRTIDECEYIFVNQGHAYGITHKANCKNPAHVKYYRLEPEP